MQAIDSSTGGAAPKDAAPERTDRGPDRLRYLAVVCVVVFTHPGSIWTQLRGLWHKVERVAAPAPAVSRMGEAAANVDRAPSAQPDSCGLDEPSSGASGRNPAFNPSISCRYPAGPARPGAHA